MSGNDCINQQDTNIGRFVEALSTEDDWLVFANLLVEIGSIAVPILLLHLEKADDSVKSRILTVLGRIGDDRAFEPIVKLLVSEDIYVCCDAIIALGNFVSKKSEAFELIVKFLSDDHSQIRSCTADALGYIGNKKAVEPLIQLLQKEQEEMVREDIVIALGKIGDAKVLPILESIRYDDSSEFVRNSADAAIQKLKQEDY